MVKGIGIILPQIEMGKLEPCFTFYVCRHYLKSSHVGSGSVVSVGHGGVSLPIDGGLLPGYPNPFNRAILLRYQVAAVDRVHLDIFDAAGQRVKRLVDGVQKGGRYQVAWDATAEGGIDVATGPYLVRLQVGGFAESRKVTLTK